MPKPLTVEVAVVGGGPAGLTAAIALAAAGVETRADRSAPPADNRTTALLAGSVAALDTLGVWAHCAAQGRAAPLDPDRRRDRAACSRAARSRSRPPRSASRPSATTSRTAHLIAALDARAADAAFADADRGRGPRHRNRRGECRDLARRAAAASSRGSSSAPTAAARSAALPPASRPTARAIRRPR